MKVLELFSGTECLSNAFRARGHECYTVDWDEKFPSTLHIDIMQLTADRILNEFGKPDVIWAGCDCTTFSVAAIGHHRRKNPLTGSLDPKTEKAEFADKVNLHTLELIKELAPKFFFIENPMGGLRKMWYMQGFPRYLITYCQYGFPYRKATDIFTNHPKPDFRPPCKNGDKCHESAPRGTQKGLQAIKGTALRSAYPPALCEHIVDICERYLDSEPLKVSFNGESQQLSLFEQKQEKMKYNKDNPLRVVTLCSGYDSQCLALEKLKKDFSDFDYDLVNWSEFDPQTPQTPLEKQPPVVAHNALFPQWKDRNLGDMTKIDWNTVPDFDLLFYSTPCQSISSAGLQHGFTEGSGTRSSIIWNVRDAVKIKRPKYLCLENVKAMVSGKFVDMFNLWQRELEKLGYANFAQVLNAKDYGVPQNRERIFLISIRMDDDIEPRYSFPKPFPLEKKLKDVLEDKVDEKYYLSDKMLECFNNANNNTPDDSDPSDETE